MAAPLILYSYSACSSCRAALTWLRARRIEFEERPIFTTPPSRAELSDMLAAQGGELRRLFNTSGLEYRSLGLKDKLTTMTKEEALQLLSTRGRVVKRPFLIGPGVHLVGFKTEVWQAAFRTD